jgi:hypothetical protein
MNRTDVMVPPGLADVPESSSQGMVPAAGASATFLPTTTLPSPASDQLGPAKWCPTSVQRSLIRRASGAFRVNAQAPAGFCWQR